MRQFWSLMCAILPAGMGLGLGTVVAQAPEALFKVEVRLVEVYATVFDQNGKYLANLTRDSFEVYEDNQAKQIVAFEASSTGLSCAILLDTTGSMGRTLPTVKNAILKLIDQARAEDRFAVYTFGHSLNRVQDFTADRGAAKRAVLRARAEGRTALFDALIQVSREISVREGKKAIVVFTDGDDNASLLNASAAWTHAKKVGIPVYAVAQGEALSKRELMEQLKDIAERTGGVAHSARNSDDIGKVFQRISSDLDNTYMLAYKPTAGDGDRWRSIRLALKGVKRFRIHAKQGYYAE